MMDNKAILEKANAAVSSGDNEGFLSFCTDDTKWTFVGDKPCKESKQFANIWQQNILNLQNSGLKI